MATPMKLITVFFDLEAPFLWKNEAKFDLVETMQNISEILDRFRIKAVFNTCGILAENFPELVAELHGEGHEVASHGYAHENFLELTMAKLNKTLAKTEKILQSITGERPIGIRSPWLMRNKQIYCVLRNRNYSWASNWYVPFWATKSHVRFHAISYPEWMVAKIIYDFKWVLHKEKPFRMDNLTEIPLLSPLDVYCIHPFPNPLENSPKISLEEAYKILVGHYKSSRIYFNLNFHPHSIGTCNRITLLEKVLGYLSSQSDGRFILPRQLVGASTNIIV
jgi:peptidoglycan/xylan/chitin deacetylase (PgdA/CDA1 family)